MNHNQTSITENDQIEVIRKIQNKAREILAVINEDIKANELEEGETGIEYQQADMKGIFSLKEHKINAEKLSNISFEL